MAPVQIHARAGLPGRGARRSCADEAARNNLAHKVQAGALVFRFGVFLAMASWAGAAIAADLPVYAPPPAWVLPAAPPKAAAAPSDAAVQILLSDRQIRFGPDGDEFYSESAFRILKPAGLTIANGLVQSWDPQTETLTFHRLNVIRDGQVIDLLAGGKKVTVVRRETNLELAMLDGDLTASIQPEDLRVGDIVDLAMTLTRRDPVLKGNSQGFEALIPLGAVERLRIRAVWPSAKPIRWRATEGMPAPKVSRTTQGQELDIEASDIEAPKAPNGAPLRYGALGQIEFSQFPDWAAVSALMAPLYAKAETIAPASQLKSEAQKIAAQSADPKVRAELALRLVQDQVRYAFVGMNLGGLVPADADVTWQRRFGDCKGKTVLLLSLLHQLGITAEPALVSTSVGDGLDQRLPILGFDHVVVRSEIGGKTYWLDGTRTGDRDLDGIEVPPFHWALPVRAVGATLEPLTQTPQTAPAFESLVRLDASGGLDAAALVHGEALFRGDAAVLWDRTLTAGSHEEADRAQREYWRGRVNSLDAKQVSFGFDDAGRVLTMRMDGSATMDWAKNEGVRDFSIADSSLGFSPDFKRDPGQQSDAPYAVNFPHFSKWTVVIILPHQGAGVGLLEAGDVDQTVAGVRYQRRTRIEGGAVTMVASEQSLVKEFAAVEVPAAAAALRQLNDYDVVVRVAASTTQSAGLDHDAELPPPTDAAGYQLRAAAYLAKDDYAKAIADLTSAMKLDPAASRYVYDRGAAHFENHQDDLALADFDHAIALNPKDELALEARAQVYLFRGDLAGAGRDFEAAAAASGGDPKVLQREALAYDSASRFEQEVALWDRVVAKTPTAEAYNHRCWARAEWGRDLALALADCDASLKLRPDAAGTSDSRGLADLQLSRLDDAIRDYSTALSKHPDQASSLYGRGVAELRKGLKAAGQADMNAAKLLDAQVAEIYDRIGVKP
jgi:tetratricopeptide (TPR) repeat protein/transglutaminase-like putative cysteine protease